MSFETTSRVQVLLKTTESFLIYVGTDIGWLQELYSSLRLFR
jgi:hypothetical protein